MAFHLTAAKVGRALLMAWMPPTTGIVMCHCDVSVSILQRESIHVRSHHDRHRPCKARVSTSRGLRQWNGYFPQETDACSASCIYEPTIRVRCCMFVDAHSPTPFERPTKLIFRGWPEVAAGSNADQGSRLSDMPEQSFVNSNQRVRFFLQRKVCDHMGARRGGPAGEDRRIRQCAV